MAFAASFRSRQSTTAVQVTYAVICVLALGFDLATDRSFGALMLAVLPISLVSLICLFVGPWLEYRRKTAVLRDWFVGALLVLLIAIGFGSLGPDQAKTGELVFTYAVLTMAFPGSLALPFATALMEPLLAESVFMRMLAAWVLCIAFGLLEWVILTLLYVPIRQRVRKYQFLKQEPPTPPSSR